MLTFVPSSLTDGVTAMMLAQCPTCRKPMIEHQSLCPMCRCLDNRIGLGLERNRHDITSNVTLLLLIATAILLVLSYLLGLTGPL